MQLKQYLIDNFMMNTGAYKSERLIQKYINPIRLQELKEVTKFIKTDSLQERIYYVINDINEKVICKNCGSRTATFTSPKRGYNTNCQSCSSNNGEGLTLRYFVYKYLSEFKLTKKNIKHIKNILLSDFKVDSHIINKIKTFVKYDVEGDWLYMLRRIRSELNSSDSASLLYYQLHFGETLGTEMFHQPKDYHQPEYLIAKYGQDWYDDMCQRKAHTLENYIKWNNGDSELAASKLLKFRKLQHHNSTSEFLNDKWGDDYDKKSSERSTTRPEYYIARGFSPEEAKEKVTERQTTFTLEKCIAKHGETEGLRVWQERQDKWQSTLNSKPVDEVDEMNAKKSSAFHCLVDTFNYTKDDAIQAVNSVIIPEFNIYSNKIDKYTLFTYNKYVDTIDPTRLRGNGYDLDHKFSRMIGYILGVDVVMMSCKYNLQILTSNENNIKGAKCSISLEELTKLYEGDLCNQ